MTRFAYQAVLVLGLISSGVLAAPTLTPRSTELQALHSSYPLPSVPPVAVVHVLEVRGTDPVSKIKGILAELKAKVKDIIEKHNDKKDEKKVEEIEREYYALEKLYEDLNAAQTYWTWSTYEMGRVPPEDLRIQKWQTIIEAYEKLLEKVTRLDGIDRKPEYRDLYHQFERSLQEAEDGQREDADEEARARLEPH
ncbi:hypothetical protein EV361DRAFT_932567 [Lentinula raphanica]|uniref:Uncharacterized protein n=1 Tax=Lentinula raphanica TaxID=153919 RepID=A0AA38P0Y1_9AGAR|nr:hypothetical protein F5878DRAFT_376699 [Lentinula raphanica]KAJ3967032.1 hypothetical protein EV361DRAFT_932567 [Lentinula raphanica]